MFTRRDQGTSATHGHHTFNLSTLSIFLYEIHPTITTIPSLSHAEMEGRMPLREKLDTAIIRLQLNIISALSQCREPICRPASNLHKKPPGTRSRLITSRQLASRYRNSRISERSIARKSQITASPFPLSNKRGGRHHGTWGTRTRQQQRA